MKDSISEPTSKSVTTDWELLMQLVRITSPSTVYASIDEKIIELDTGDNVLVLGEDGVPKEKNRSYKIPMLANYSFSLEFNGAKHQLPMGLAKRPLDDANRFMGYSPQLREQFEHQAGCRLSGLPEQAEVFFTSALLGYDKEKVTPELIEKLLKSKNTELDIIKDPALEFRV